VTAKMAADRKKLFHLREYDTAFRNVFSRVLRLRAEEAYPLLKEIPTEPRPAIHTSQVTLPSGEALTNEPFDMKVAFRFNLSDMVSGNIDAFTASAEASGREYGEQTMRQLLKYSGTISEGRRCPSLMASCPRPRLGPVRGDTVGGRVV
jgi:hypothetical protein